MDLTWIVDRWARTREGLLDLICEFDDDELVFRPFATSWTAGEIMLHLAITEEGWLRYGVARKLDAWPRDLAPEDYATVAAVVGVLTMYHARTEAFLDALTPGEAERVIRLPWDESMRLEQILWHLLEHEIHHRGELSLILGMLGRHGWGA